MVLISIVGFYLVTVVRYSAVWNGMLKSCYALIRVFEVKFLFSPRV